jgi:hypothetical protein
MPDYQLGMIYKIECNVTGQRYIGSTCEPILARRLAGHITNYKSYLNGKFNYVSSFKIFENRDYCIVLLEKYPCDTKDELLARERHWCNELECINQRKNQGMLNEFGRKGYDKQYHEKNIDIIHAKQNEKHICICGNCYTYANKIQHLKSKKHLYYLKHKTIIDGLNMIKALDKLF